MVNRGQQIYELRFALMEIEAGQKRREKKSHKLSDATLIVTRRLCWLTPMMATYDLRQGRSQEQKFDNSCDVPTAYDIPLNILFHSR